MPFAIAGVRIASLLAVIIKAGISMDSFLSLENYKSLFEASKPALTRALLQN